MADRSLALDVDWRQCELIFFSDINCRLGIADR
jgi:hypothetical protein